ncbi:MAG: hypothetical protein U0Q16_05195 [Bryobacteraceae bacterium]
METALKRVKISQSLLESIATQIVKGESVAVIAPRHGGKSYVTKHVLSKLKACGLSPQHCSFYRSEVIDTEKDVVGFLAKQVTDSGPAATIGEFFEGLHRQSIESGKRAVLSLAHVDSLHADLAATVLRQIRAEVNAGTIVALITAESHIFDLVTGPDSCFNAAHEYLLQGFDRDCFGAEFASWKSVTGIQFESDDAAFEEFFRTTGGNTSLVRRFLHNWLDRRVTEELSSAPITVADIKRIFQRLIALGAHGTLFFQRAAEITSSDLSAIKYIDQLLSDCVVPASPGKPSLLELSGVAVADGPSLQFSSPLMRDFIRSHFHPIHLGDIHALAGEWAIAFEHYRRSDGALPCRRPVNFADGVTVASVVQQLCKRFKSLDALDRLKTTLSDGLVSIFGIECVRFLHRAADGNWTGGSRDTDACHGQLPVPDPKVGLQELSKDGRRTGFCLTLGGVAPETLESIYVQDSEVASVSPHRATLLKEALEGFKEAYEAHVKDLVEQWRLEFGAAVRQSLNRALESLFLDAASSDPSSVLRSFGEALTTGTPWFQSARLQSPGEALDPGTEIGKLTARVRELGGARIQCSRAGCVIPVRVDGFEKVLVLEGEAKLSPEVIQDELEKVHDPLLRAIKESKRSMLVRNTLDRLSEAIFIFDEGDKLVYMNEPAAAVCGRDSVAGWQTRVAGDSVPNEIAGAVRAPTDRCRRVVSFAGQIGSEQSRWTLVSDYLEERKERLGTSVHIQEESFFRVLLGAYRVAVSARSEQEALDQLLDVLPKVSWIRKYKYEAEKNQLTAETCIDSREGVQERFKGLKLRDESSLHCVKTGEAAVFWYPDKEIDLSQGRHFTKRGLEVIVSADPPKKDELEKKKGDYWIDFPLKYGTKVEGKFTLPCDQDLSPERFEMYQALANILGEVLNEKRRLAPRAPTATKSSGAGLWMRSYTSSGAMLNLAHSSNRRLPQDEGLGYDAIRIKRDEANKESWRAIDEGRPIIFKFDPDGSEGASSKTQSGLEVVTRRNPPFAEELGKMAGDLWIDFPVWLQNGTCGKVTVPCEETFTPEYVSMLDVVIEEMTKVTSLSLAPDFVGLSAIAAYYQQVAEHSADPNLSKHLEIANQLLSAFLEKVDKLSRFPEKEEKLTS